MAEIKSLYITIKIYLNLVALWINITDQTRKYFTIIAHILRVVNHQTQWRRDWIKQKYKVQKYPATVIETINNTDGKLIASYFWRIILII